MAEGTRGGISISKIKRLELKPDWRQWIRDINSYLLENEWDDDKPVEPAGVGTRAQAQPGGAGAIYFADLDRWNKQQKKACNAILFVCGTRAYEFAKPLEPNRKAILEKLETEFKPTGEALFHDLDSRYSGINLAEYQSIEDYIIAFDTVIVELKEIGDDRTLNAPSCIKHFIQGLGPAFGSWEQSFNQQHPYFGVNATTLNQAQESASTESFRLKRTDRGGDQIALLSAKIDAVERTNVALMSQLNSNGKRNQERDGGRDNKRASGNCHKCLKYPGILDPRHSPTKCWLDFPHLKTQWEEKFPERAKARADRLLAKGLQDPTRRVTIIENSPVPATTQHARMAIHGIAKRARFDNNEI